MSASPNTPCEVLLPLKWPTSLRSTLLEAGTDQQRKFAVARDGSAGQGYVAPPACGTIGGLVQG